jgi:hypothetical protein
MAGYENVTNTLKRQGVAGPIAAFPTFPVEIRLADAASGAKSV